MLKSTRLRHGAEENDAESCRGFVELYESCLPKDPAAKMKAKREAARMLVRALPHCPQRKPRGDCLRVDSCPHRARLPRVRKNHCQAAAGGFLSTVLHQSLRGRFGKSKDKNGYTKFSIVKLLIVTVVMGVLLILYLYAVYLFIDSWATFIVVGVLVAVIVYGKGGSSNPGSGKTIEQMRQQERNDYERYKRNQDENYRL